MPPVDECTLNPGQCGEGGHCIDTASGYICQCYEGFNNVQPSDRCVGEA